MFLPYILRQKNLHHGNSKAFVTLYLYYYYALLTQKNELVDLVSDIYYAGAEIERVLRVPGTRKILRSYLIKPALG